MPRIIAGTLGGRPLTGTVGKGTRPTSDRVREAVFSRLDGWDAITGARVLDLFAGTGALAVEALSRGAASALLVEAHAASARQLQRSVKDLGLSAQIEVRVGKAEQVATSVSAAVLPAAAPSAAAPSAAPSDTTAPAAAAPAGGAFDLVFIDPPYEYPTDAVEALLATLLPALSADAVVVVERSSRSRPISWPEGYADDGTKSYGETVVQYGGPASAASSDITTDSTTD